MLYNVYIYYKCMYILHHVTTTTSFCGIEPPDKFSKRGVLTGSGLLEGFTGKEGLNFFRKVAVFT